MEKMSMGTFGPKGPPEDTAMVNPFNPSLVVLISTAGLLAVLQYSTTFQMIWFSLLDLKVNWKVLSNVQKYEIYVIRRKKKI